MKTNTNQLREKIRSLIITKCERVNYNQAPSLPKYPYVVFSLNQLLDDGGRIQYDLEVNCVSKKQAEVEMLADAIQDVLHEYLYSDLKISFLCYKNQRITVLEEDKNIKRQKLNFRLDVYFKEV